MKRNMTQSTGGHPSGLKGRIAGKLMNAIHRKFYRKVITDHILKNSTETNKLTVLDMGCGGGIAVQLFAESQLIEKVTGIDHSPEMVLLSSRVNREHISSGKVCIKQAEVEVLPFKENSFDIVTAFDTINFWSNHNQALSEIHRVLKKGGSCYIVNAYPREGSRWHEFVSFKNDAEYRTFLSGKGMSDVNSIFLKQSIIVSGRKS